MRGTLVALALAALLAPMAVGADRSIEVKSGAFSIQVDVRAQANLIYHINCLARDPYCTSEVFVRLWQQELGSGAADDKKLQEWTSLRDALRRVSEGQSKPLPLAMVPIDDGEDDVWTKIRNAEFTASNADELKRSWRGLMPADTAARLVEIIEHFRPRFEGWWRTHESEVSGFVPGVEAALRRAKAAELLGATARLYRSDLGDRRLFLHVLLQPTSLHVKSSANLVGAHLAVEIVANEPPEERADVIVHELAHHLFARMLAKTKAWLADEMLTAGFSGTSAWNLFDEVQATVIGNMLAERNLKTPEQFQKQMERPFAFYADEAIDLGARATEHVIANALKYGTSMRASFPNEFVAALKAGLGDKLETPALYLRRMLMNIDDESSPWIPKIIRSVRAGSMSMSPRLGSADFVEMLKQFPGAGVVVVAKPDQLVQLAPAASGLGVTPEALTAALGSSRGVVVISQRAPSALAFTFVARDTRAMDGLIVGFQYCQLKPGICVRIQ